MSDTWILVLFLLLLSAIYQIIVPRFTSGDIAASRRRLERTYEQEVGFPDELKFASGGEVVGVVGIPLDDDSIPLSGEKFHCDSPVALTGYPDEIYRNADGKLVAVDTVSIKAATGQVDSIDRVIQSTPSEQVQLSVYRYIMVHGLRQEAAEYGYIRRVDAQGNCLGYIGVPTLDDAEVESLTRQCKAVGRKEPGKLSPASGRVVCAGCEQKNACPHPLV